VGDLSFNISGQIKRHPVLYNFYFNKPKKLVGKVALLSSNAHQRYYHWMFDILPRINLLQRSNINVDAYIINNSLNFQKESLKIIGLPQDKIINPNQNSHFIIEELIVPSLPGASNIVTKESCDFLRKTFIKSSYKSSLNLYLSRKDAATRRIVNEDETISLLEKYDFKIITLDNLTVEEQVDIFSRAKIIVGPHGAGFSNIVFCNSGADIIELMPENYFNPCFWSISNAISLNHKIIECRPKYFESNRKIFKEYIKHDIFVDLNELESVLKETL
ncbi:MAG: glycosyltransferase family 61 protein, partial [Thermodesulfobacteriota bacterium]